MSDDRRPGPDGERRARWLGVAAALAAMAAATALLHWPAPAVSAALGYGVYLAVRPRRATR